jgi:hypothetical protein
LSDAGKIADTANTVGEVGRGVNLLSDAGKTLEAARAPAITQDAGRAAAVSEDTGRAAGTADKAAAITQDASKAPAITGDASEAAQARDRAGVASRVADGVPDKQGSLRLKYMGATPDKFSRTGAAVVERMRSSGQIVGEGPLLRGNPNGLKLVVEDSTPIDIDSKIDMAHTTDAVTWWNQGGRFFGPKSPEVRQFMLDPKNYVLQPSSINRSAGARLGETYLPPDPPDFTSLKR